MENVIVMRTQDKIETNAPKQELPDERSDVGVVQLPEERRFVAVLPIDVDRNGRRRRYIARIRRIGAHRRHHRRHDLCAELGERGEREDRHCAVAHDKRQRQLVLAVDHKRVVVRWGEE